MARVVARIVGAIISVFKLEKRQFYDLVNAILYGSIAFVIFGASVTTYWLQYREACYGTGLEHLLCVGSSIYDTLCDVLGQIAIGFFSKLIELPSILLQFTGQAFVSFLVFEFFQMVHKAGNHYFREYQDTNVISWNIFVHKRGKVSFQIPSEETFLLSDLMSDDEILLSKVIDASKADHYDPNFVIKIEDKYAEEEFLRRLTNRVSQSIKSSAWPAYALSRLRTAADKRESPLMLAVCEKDEGVVAHVTRTWLIFPSELRWLRQFTLEQIKDDSDSGVFQVEKSHWRIRIANLWRWANCEYPADGSERISDFPSKTIILPCQSNI
jgi:hypothetical protein